MIASGRGAGPGSKGRAAPLGGAASQPPDHKIRAECGLGALQLGLNVSFVTKASPALPFSVRWKAFDVGKLIEPVDPVT
jgi:hypothetical protein